MFSPVTKTSPKRLSLSQKQILTPVTKTKCHVSQDSIPQSCLRENLIKGKKINFPCVCHDGVWGAGCTYSTSALLEVKGQLNGPADSPLKSSCIN